jgi:VWFA-related protein
MINASAANVYRGVSLSSAPQIRVPHAITILPRDKPTQHSEKRSRRLAILVLTCLLPILALPTLSGGQAAPQTTAPTLKVYSRETIVDVTVTDSKGNPVRGLTRDNFTVKEDNKPQPIRSFEEFGAKSVQPPPQLPPNVYTNLQPPAPTGATNVLWLDFTNAAPVLAAECCLPPLDPSAGALDLSLALGRQRRTKLAAITYLKQMPTGTRAAVFGTWYPPGHLRVLQGVASDPALLSAAVDTMPFDQDGLLMLGRGIVAPMGPPEAWCAQQERRNRMTLESLNQIAASLVQIKGRKNLLWFTMRIRSLVDQHPDPCLTNHFEEIQRAYGLLAAAQVTVYPISVRGVEENSIDHAEDILGLETVAEATGGAAFYNSNDIADLAAKAISSGSDYYTLSYIPPGLEYDGRQHTIKIVADTPGLKLTYRDEYYAEDPRKLAPTPSLTLAVAPASTGREDTMHLAMGRAMPTSTDILFDVQVEPSTIPPKPDDPPILGTLDPTVATKLKGKPLTRYGFQYAIPARQLTFTPGPHGTHKGALELDIAVYDGDLYGSGKLITGLSQTVSMPLSDARYQEFIKGPFRFTQQLDLPAGQFFLRIGALDTTSNKVGTLEIPLTVPKN